ncbi:MAG TPA: hypothetical protein VHG28_12690 [Longimicrobiaceae bacterium]|nr:hypothetical protein [Longimicrobiaceae bacterium]
MRPEWCREAAGGLRLRERTRPRQLLVDAGGDHLDAGRVVAAAGDDDEEYWRAHRHLGFTWEELVETSLMGFDSASMHRPDELALIERVRAEIAELEGAPVGV